MKNRNYNKWVGITLSLFWWGAWCLSEKPEALIIANVFLGAVLILEVIGEDNE